MLARLILPLVCLGLFYGFWASDHFTAIAAGVAVFLFGMSLLEQGFKAYTGGTLEKLLTRSTRTTTRSLMFGVVATSVMQSSSLVSVITISFLSAGLINLAQGIGIIFGANIGTTTGAWLIAGVGLKVQISAYAMPLLVIGTVLTLQSRTKLHGLGWVLAGIGFLFLGIHYMKEGFDAFKDQIDLATYAMPGLIGLLVYTLLGSLATVVMQSSHATLVLTITALASGQIDYDNALALAIGANIGTTVTAVIGSMKASRDGKRLALAHFVFNSSTALVAIVAIVPLRLAVDGIADLVGIAPDDYTLKLSIFHTLFNVIGVAMMLPLMPALIRYLLWILPQRDRRESLQLDVPDAERRSEAATRYLNDAAMAYPDAAMKVIMEEVRHLLGNMSSVMAYGLYLRSTDLDDPDHLQDLAVEPPKTDFGRDLAELYRQHIKGIYSDIIEYSARAEVTMNAEQQRQIFQLKMACRQAVEAVKDVQHLRKNLQHYLFSPQPVMRAEYQHLRRVLAQVLAELDSVRKEKPVKALLSIGRLRVMLEKEDVIASGKVDALLRSRQVTGTAATSLINDATYARKIAHNLINVIEIWLGASSEGAGGVMGGLALESADIAAMTAPPESNEASRPAAGSDPTR